MFYDAQYMGKYQGLHTDHTVDDYFLAIISVCIGQFLAETPYF